MLIDIFARRYESTPLRDGFEERDRRLLVQGFRILAEDLYPYYRDGKEDSVSKAFWTNLHSRLSRELGLQELSREWFTYATQWQGVSSTQTSRHTMVTVCENWLTQPLSGSPDQHIKERLSLIELGFRQREFEIGVMNATPVTPDVESLAKIGLRVPGNPSQGAKSWRETKTQMFRASVEELNARFRQAGYALHYHNGFIQAATDTLIQETVETPFWALVADPAWGNVDTDMKEALDRRDGGDRDPAWYAARALESAIKIICDMKSWTTGNEKGAHNFIDRLAAKTNKFIERWEAESLKAFFTEVRNPLGHGPGSGQMRHLSSQQTEWAIEFCMSWIKSLIRRL